MSEPSIKVFVTHAQEDDARCGPLLEMLDAWDVDYVFDRHPGAIEKLSGRVQKALGESRVLLRVCTRNTSRSYKMSLETGGFITLQAQDHREGGPERREVINLILDPDYQREPFDFTSAILDATQAHATGWVNDLRRALGLDPLTDDDAAAVARRMTYRPQVSRRRALALGAASAVTLAAAAAGGTAFVIKSHSGGPKPTPTPTPRTVDTQLLWYTRVFDPSGLGDKGVVRAPLLFGSSIYTGALDGTLSALEPGTGKIRWQKHHSAAMYVSPIGLHGYVCTSWAEEDLGVFAFDAESGAQMWNTPGQNGPSSTLTAHDGRVYITEFKYGGFLAALDAVTGRELYYAYVDHDSTVPASAPTFVGNMAYVGGWDGYLYAFDLHLPTQSTEVWKVDAGAGRAAQIGRDTFIQSNPFVVNGVLYVGSADNSLYAFDAQTGAKRWSFETGSAINGSSPVVANDVVYIGSTDNSLYALNAETGTLLWRYATGDKIQSSPVVMDGIVYFGSRDTYVHAVNTQNGQLVRKYKTGAEVAADIVIAADTIYAGALDGYLYAFRV